MKTRNTNASVRALKMSRPMDNRCQPYTPAVPRYPIASYDTYADLKEALRRDFHVAVGDEYNRKIVEPVRLSTSCTNIYIENDRFGFRLLPTKQELTGDKAKAAFMRR
jgi:hypothetical protein